MDPEPGSGGVAPTYVTFTGRRDSGNYRNFFENFR
jgi:hypothetical protein